MIPSQADLNLSRHPPSPWTRNLSCTLPLRAGFCSGSAAWNGFTWIHMNSRGFTSLVATPKVMCHTRAVDTIAECNLSHIAISAPWWRIARPCYTRTLNQLHWPLFVLFSWRSNDLHRCGILASLWLPPPQDLEQFPHASHSDQRQSWSIQGCRLQNQNDCKNQSISTCIASLYIQPTPEDRQFQNMSPHWSLHLRMGFLQIAPLWSCLASCF